MLVGDWKRGKMEAKTPRFRIACLVAALWALVLPALGTNPVSVTIAAQVSNVFVLPLTVFAIMWLLNRKSVMGSHRAGLFLNQLLVAAFAFSLAVAYTGAKVLIGIGRATENTLCQTEKIPIAVNSSSEDGKMNVVETVAAKRVIAIVRGFAPETCLKLAEAYVKGGIGLVEVTFNQQAPQT